MLITRKNKDALTRGLLVSIAAVKKVTPCFFKTAGVGCFNLKTSRVISAGSLCFGPEAECGALMAIKIERARGTDSLLTCDRKSG